MLSFGEKLGRVADRVSPLAKRYLALADAFARIDAGTAASDADVVALIAYGMGIEPHEVDLAREGVAVALYAINAELEHAEARDREKRS